MYWDGARVTENACAIKENYWKAWHTSRIPEIAKPFFRFKQYQMSNDLKVTESLILTFFFRCPSTRKNDSASSLRLQLQIVAVRFTKFKVGSKLMVGRRSGFLLRAYLGLCFKGKLAKLVLVNESCRWWFQICSCSPRNPWEMIQFDVCIFFKWVETQPPTRLGKGETTPKVHTANWVIICYLPRTEITKPEK